MTFYTKLGRPFRTAPNLIASNKSSSLHVVSSNHTPHENKNRFSFLISRWGFYFYYTTSYRNDLYILFSYI